MSILEQSILADLPAVEAPATFILQQLDIYNWGPFAGRHCAELDRQGTAIIGATGSGKTTLVDALMTLLTAQPKYNLASTGGHESDRDLISYIRGVSGTGNETGDNQHIARSGSTLTGLSARFHNGRDWVQIATLQWIDSVSMAAADRRDIWIFCTRGDQSLDQWLELHHEGGVRAIKQYGRDTSQVQIFDTKKAYLAKLRDYFEVSENAFNLLNRAAGLKQLNSIDEIFRELVLDDRSAFNRAAEVAAEFDNLATIHQELLTARKQQQSLQPLTLLYRQFLQFENELQELEQLKKWLPRGFAQSAQKLWQVRLEQIDAQITELTHAINQQQGESDRLSELAEQLRLAYMQLGGNSIEQLQQKIAVQKMMVEQRKQDAESYLQICKTLSMNDAITEAALQQNQAWAEKESERLAIQMDEQQQQIYELGAQCSQYKNQVQELSEEIKKIVARPDSNIPGHYHDFRTQLAEELAIDEQRLPFVAELIEVSAKESAWRGAIERALGGQRLRLLIPPSLMQHALSWVEKRDNKLYVRLLEAREGKEPPHFYSDGFSHKLNFKEHALTEPLKAFLTTLDRHCVDSAERLRQTPNGMTIHGLMSGSAGRFEKQDQQPLNRGWMTGFNNRDRLNSLQQELDEVNNKRVKSQQQFDDGKSKTEIIRQHIQMMARLQELQFERINYPQSLLTLNGYQQQLDALLAPDSDVEKARQQYEQIQYQYRQSETQRDQLGRSLGKLEERQHTTHHHYEITMASVGAPFNDAELLLLKNWLPILTDADLDKLELLEREALQLIDQQHQQRTHKLREQERNLVRQMSNAKIADSGALSEVGSELVDIPHYLNRLQKLNEEALPEKTQRFLSYLNQSSDQGVTQLLTDIDSEVRIIEERISDLNQTLKRVEFQPGHYLQLHTRQIRHESLRTLENAQRHLRSAALQGEETGEQHYQALSKVVELLRQASDNKRTVGARALLDPRYRLQFLVGVVNKETDNNQSVRSGSQGGSGGEKEIFASYVLTASLSYALCPEGLNRPLFGTIVLDEAFSKSSQAVGGRIIAALRTFGLHPLLVTPNKEMRLLRENTRAAILVCRKGARATLTSISWKALEQQAQKRYGKNDEIT